MPKSSSALKMTRLGDLIPGEADRLRIDDVSGEAPRELRERPLGSLEAEVGALVELVKLSLMLAFNSFVRSSAFCLLDKLRCNVST